MVTLDESGLMPLNPVGVVGVPEGDSRGGESGPRGDVAPSLSGIGTDRLPAGRAVSEVIAGPTSPKSRS